MIYVFEHVTKIVRRIQVHADNESQAEAKASCGSIEHIREKEGVKQLSEQNHTEVRNVSVQLKRITWEDVLNNVSLLNSETAFEGSWENCKTTAESNGFKWKDSSNVFGGYWVNDDGDCMMPV